MNFAHFTYLIPLFFPYGLLIRLLIQRRGRRLFRTAYISLGEPGLCHSFLRFREGLLQDRYICRNKHYRVSSFGPIRVFDSIGLGLVL